MVAASSGGFTFFTLRHIYAHNPRVHVVGCDPHVFDIFHLGVPVSSRLTKAAHFSALTFLTCSTLTPSLSLSL